MNTIEIITSVVITIVGLLFISQILIKKKIDVEEVIEDVEKGIDIVQIVLDSFPFPTGYKLSISNILDITDRVVEVLHNIHQVDLNKGDKMRLALDTIKETLSELDVQPNEAQQKLINVVIKESIKWLEQNK